MVQSPVPKFRSRLDYVGRAMAWKTRRKEHRLLPRAHRPSRSPSLDEEVLEQTAFDLPDRRPTTT